MSTSPAVPLSVLDLSPIPSGSVAADAIRNTIDLARRTEEFGYHRYWLAEHHLTPGVASSSPSVLITLVADATQRIRVGSGAVLLGLYNPLTVVEHFGTIAAVHPGRIDLGLGRSVFRHPPAAKPASDGVSAQGGPSGPPSDKSAPDKSAPGNSAPGESTQPRVHEGLLIPKAYRFDNSALLHSPRFALQMRLVARPGSDDPDYSKQVRDVIAFLKGEYVSEGLDAHAVPGEDADVALWILGSSGGVSATLAGELGLPFAANYHVSPGTVLDSVAGYRSAFRPSETLAEPYVLVSADVVVADDDATARELASPYAAWVRSIRTGLGAIQFPTPQEAAEQEWTDEQRALVADRVDTQFVGSPATVAEKLRVLQRATGADELLITTVTHDHVDRVRSYELLAKEWAGPA